MTIEVAEAFRLLFSGINYDYGDQRELNAWIQNRNNLRNPNKYPLVWGILDDGTISNGIFEGEINLIVMNVTQLDKFNKWRYANIYSEILIPLCNTIEQKILSNPTAIQVMHNGNLQNRFRYSDQPNYGLKIDNPKANESDFKSIQKKGEQSTVIDIVDARMITFKSRIKINCLK